MKIDHVAMYVQDIEVARHFMKRFFLLQPIRCITIQKPD